MIFQEALQLLRCYAGHSLFLNLALPCTIGRALQGHLMVGKDSLFVEKQVGEVGHEQPGGIVAHSSEGESLRAQRVKRITSRRCACSTRGGSWTRPASVSLDQVRKFGRDWAR